MFKEKLSGLFGSQQHVQRNKKHLKGEIFCDREAISKTPTGGYWCDHFTWRDVPGDHANVKRFSSELHSLKRTGHQFLAFF